MNEGMDLLFESFWLKFLEGILFLSSCLTDKYILRMEFIYSGILRRSRSTIRNTDLNKSFDFLLNPFCINLLLIKIMCFVLRHIYSNIYAIRIKYVETYC